MRAAIKPLSEVAKYGQSGLADIAEGRIADFDADRIIARGRKLFADRSNSVSPKRRNQT